MTNKNVKITKSFGDKESYGKHIYTKTHNQTRLIESIEDHIVTVVTGPAGSGKTFVSIAKAIAEIRNNQTYSKLILTRPVVESDEHLGFLPGDLQDKMSPYMKPLHDAINYILGEHEKINTEISPLAYMRGRTFDNAIIIMDEAQNATIGQMKMILTRIGMDSKLIITGDDRQCDLKVDSGLIDFIKKLENDSIKEVKHIEMDENDVVRNPVVKDILNLYEKNT